VETKFNRQYNVDVNPRLLLGESETVRVMCKSEMDKYMDFKAIKRILYFW
jgi:RAB protein geranylgeranyltransferase component A